MLDEVVETTERATYGVAAAHSYDDATESLSRVLLDGESIRHALVLKKITHRRDDRETTLKPDGDHRAVAVVTGQRVLVFVGDGGAVETPDVAIPLRDVMHVEKKSSLLRSDAVVVRSEEQSVRFVPEIGNVDEFVSYVDRISATLRELRTTLDDAREEIETYRDRCADGADVAGRERGIESQIESARATANEHSDGPIADMRERVDEVAAAFETVRIDHHLDRLEADLDAAAEAGEHETFCTRLAETAETLASIRQSINEDVGPATLDDAAATLDDRASRFLAAADEAREAAQDAELPEATEHYAEAVERYRAAAAVDTPIDAFDDADVRERYETVARGQIDALRSLAADLERAGDEAGDDVTDEYERATEAIERARELAADLSDGDPSAFDDDLDRLREAAERSMWEWGGE
jgi:hypothetical protein